MSAAGRSVVASAPALGAGDREFESPRPDHVVRPRSAATAAGPAPDVRRASDAPSHSPRSPPTVKSDLETLNPTRVKLTVEVPFEELKPSLDAAYKKIGSQVHHPRVPQGQGAAAGHRPAVRPRDGARRGRQRGAAALLRRGRRGQRRQARSASPRSTSPRSRTASSSTFTAEVDVRPEFDLPDYDGPRGHGRRRRGHRRRGRRAARRAARAVRHPDRGRAGRRRRRLRVDRPVGRASTARRSRTSRPRA